MSGNKIAQKEVKLLKGKNMKYVTRRRGTCSRTPSNPDLTPTATTVRETGQGSGVAMVAQPTASNGWRLGSDTVNTTNGSGSYGRKRPRRGTVTRGDDMAKTSVRPTHSVAPFSTQQWRTWTAARQLARPATPTHSDSQDLVRTLRQTHTQTHSPTTSLMTIGLLSFTHSAQLLELSYTVSRLHDRLTVY